LQTGLPETTHVVHETTHLVHKTNHVAKPASLRQSKQS